MRLEGQEESTNVEDRRGMGIKGGAALGGGGLLVVMLIAFLFNRDPGQIASQIGVGGGGPQGVQSGQVDPAEEQAAKFTKIILGDTEKVWDEQFARLGRPYPKPTLVLFSGQVESACGSADAQVGPFYCPGDQRVYIDLSFYKDMQKQLNAPGDFARAYVVAHEVGHHVQRELGYSAKERALVAAARGDKAAANRASVRLELQADYLAGVWAHHAQKKFNFLEPGDLETALNAANAIGDDRLQKQARGRVVPDSFTHGTSAQRVRWFRAGFDSGDVRGAAQLFELPYDRL
ncbi:MAG TPA: neutral zinc metallopeptidase [Humisphaera sp.]